MSCAFHAQGMPSPKVVSVNGIVIPRDAIAREVQFHPAAKPIVAWQAAARALVIRELLLQQARRMGIEVKPLRDAAGRREDDEEALIRLLVEQEVKTPEPEESACRRYYEKNRRLFRSPEVYEAAHILFAAPHDDAEAFERARHVAGSVLAELKLCPARFAELARLHSACSSAAQGGNLGQITTGQTTAEFERVLVALEPGAICDAPVATRYGFHIIRLDRRIEGRDLCFDLVADRIADYLREAVTRRATAQYIARLVTQAEISGIAIAGAEAHLVS
jgi:peptidyl-prolyl cis-trans isomerase C